MQSVKEAKVAARAAELNTLGIEHVPCGVCGVPTGAARGGERCNNCWEVEHRLKGYLRDGGHAALCFILDALAVEGYHWPIQPVGRAREL
jgi:hypothetical protein